MRIFSSHFCIRTFESRRFFQSTVKLFHESEDLRDIFHRSFHFLPKAMISPRQPARLCTWRFSCATIWRLTCAKYLQSTPTFYRSLPSVLVSVNCDIELAKICKILFDLTLVTVLLLLLIQNILPILKPQTISPVSNAAP